jgi:2-methylaconitate cis-trans-isomerase PrpF
MGLVERPLEAGDVGKIGELARVRIRREELGELAAVHVEVAAGGRVRGDERIDGGVEERRCR